MKNRLSARTSTRLLCLLLTLALTLPAMILGVSADTIFHSFTQSVTAPAALAGLAPVEHDYVPGGLVAWYSGVQNTRSGHNTNSTVWQDLIGTNHVNVQTNADNYFTSEGFHLKAAQNTFPQAITNTVNGQEFTIELHIADLTVSSGMPYNTLMNSTNDNFALFRRNDGDNLEFKFAANAAPDRHSIGGCLQALQDTLITITYRVGGTCDIYYNGVLQQSKFSPSAMGADDLFFGHAEQNRQFEAVYKNIRFYNRALSAGEVKRNALVDGFGTYEGLYVQNGLVSFYSGEKNTRTGHSTNSTVWQDLIGSNNVTVAKNADNYFTEEGYHLKVSQNTFPQAIVNVINGREFTVELHIANLTSLPNMAYNTVMNSTNDNFALFRRTANDTLEFKFAANAAPDRISLSDGLSVMQDVLITITYRVGGQCNVYYNGVLKQSKSSPNAMGADDLFFGHAQEERQFEALYKGMRFYNRALSDAEVLSNAGADGVSGNAIADPKLVTVAQPTTNIVGDIAMVRELNTKAELTAVSTATRKPATVIATIDKDLNVKGTNGTIICTVDELLGTTALTVLTAFRVSDTATVDALTEYLARINLYDVLLLSDDPSIVRYAREKMPTTSGVIDFTKTFAGKTALTEEDCLTIRRTVKANNAYIAILPVSLCSNDTVQYLFNRQVNVWAKASDTPSKAEQYRAILSGAVGVISDDTAALLTAATTLPKNTVTRVPLNIGHRGIPPLAPENTIEGALLAHQKGANVIELDIYVTKDNEVVIMHDGNTDRTCNGNLDVEGSTLAQLKSLYVNKNHENHAGFSTCRIPTLGEFLDAFRGKDCQLFIEIKSANTAIIPLMKQIIEARDMYGQCSVITFHPHQLQALRQYYPEMSGGLLCASKMSDSTGNSDVLFRQDMNMIARYNATLNPSYSAANYLSSNDTRVAFFRGISIYPWTFRGDINVYKTPFIEGHAGLTGDNADTFSNVIRSIEYISLHDGSHVAIGDVAPLNVIATFFDGRTTATKDGVAVTVLEGADCVTNGANGLTFTKNGTVSFVISYTTNIGGNTYVLHCDPITVTVGNVPSSAIVHWNDRTGGSQVMSVNIDELHPVVNGTVGSSLFTPGQSHAWNRIATLDESVDSLVSTGWLAFNTSSYTFGYAIDGGTPVFKAEFTDVTDDAVKNAAAAMGAPACSRFDINVDVSTLSGEHTVDLLIKQANGAVVSFSSFTVVKPIDPDETTTPEVTTTEPEETTEKTTTPVVDPVYNVGLDHIVNMAGSTIAIHSQHASAAWAQDNSFVTLTVKGSDPYVAAIEMHSNIVATNRLYIVYRTNTEAAPEIFIGSGAEWNGNGDTLTADAYIADGEWHLMEIDLSSLSAFNGTNAGYLRYDFFATGAAPIGSTIDVKMIAFFNSDAEAEAYATANYGLSFVPEVTTTEPEVTTTEPEVTTTEPEVSTTEPEVTTTEPEDTTEPQHFCSFGAWSEARPATCTEGGVSIRRCACGNSESKAIPATGHTAGNWIVDSAARPGVNGSRHIECTACHITLKTEIIPALPVEPEPGHTCSFGDWSETIPATCTAGGLSTRTCVCGNFESKSIPAPGHNEGDWIVDSEAQPGENGSKHVECTVCHTTLKSEIIPALPVVTTPEPEVTTTEPEVTTTEPEVTTTEPEVTTTEPEVTTSEPEVTTTEPEVTTSEPEVTTSEPDESSTQKPDNDNGKLPVGAVIAIVIGAVLVAGGIGFALYWFVFKKKKG